MHSQIECCRRRRRAISARTSAAQAPHVTTALEKVARIRSRQQNKFKRNLQRKAMWPSLRHAAATFIIIACLSLAAAAQVGHEYRGRETADALAMAETTGNIGGSERATAGLALSDEQRGRIYEGVMRIRDAAVADVPAPDVADALPSGVPLQDLPAGLAREIPMVEGHKFVKLDDRIVVIDPKNRVVVAMIPRYKLVP